MARPRAPTMKTSQVCTVGSRGLRARASRCCGAGVSVLIPCLNEERTVTRVVEEVRRRLPGSQIVVVDDGSTDETSRRLTSLARQERIVLLRHEVTRGKGAALRTGLQHARGEVVVIQDADLEYSTTDLPSLLLPFEDASIDAVVGSRFQTGAYRGYRLNQWANRLLTGLANLANGTRYTDIAAGYKAFRRSTLLRLAIDEAGFAVDAELMAKLARGDFRVVEVPIGYRPRSYQEGKKIRARDVFRVAYASFCYGRRFGLA